DVILAASKGANASVARQRAKALAVLHRAEVSGEILIVTNIGAILLAMTQTINFSQRQENRDNQRAGAAHPRRLWKIAGEDDISAAPCAWKILRQSPRDGHCIIGPI